MKLIVEMKMPNDCPMCPMSHYNKLDEFTGCEVAPNKMYAVKTDKAYAESIGRPDWCPIKGVLPDEHGDLIDRDVARKYVIERWKNRREEYGNYYETGCEYGKIDDLEWLDSLPTIDAVIAEERKESV